MAHLLQSLAQHLHLSASQYWQMRLLCSISLGPLVAVLFLVIFNKRRQSASEVLPSERQMRVRTLHPTVSRL
ncbi:MAG: hypothetical protein EOO63_18305 [Hymenobacter sp.]|nr:MAG: hypothetical protein EOO63_18305 [Hymenobacter sp.]